MPSRRTLTIVVSVIVVGFFIGLFTGFVENEPGYYGFPLAWRMVDSTGQRYTFPFELFVDCLFGIALASVVAISAIVTAKKMTKEPSKTVKKKGRKKLRVT